MMKRLVRALILRPRLGERGGVALVMVLSFMVLAVPLTTTGLRTAGQLQRASRVYDDRLHAMYNASSGIEAALYELLSDPAFDDDLTPSTPSKHVVVENNDETMTVTITKIFSSETLQGQGIVVDKTVSTPYDPGVVPADTLTTYTFTIIVKNEGTGTVELVGIYDYLPPGMTYVPSSTSGLTAEEPNIGQIADATCGSTPDDLWWNLSGDDVSLADGQQLTLTFQAAGTLPDGVYYNQAQIRYDPWWTAPDQYIYTPYIAEVTVGAGGQKCGYEMEIAVSQAVTPETPSPGVPTEFTYTITVENVSASTRYVCKVEDLLPPTFTYDVLSAGDYPSNVRTVEPEELQEISGRWSLRWADGLDSSLESLVTMPAGTTSTQVFRANAIPESGMNYFNEFDVVWARSLNGGTQCKTSDSGTTYGGAGESSDVEPPPTYDIMAVAADGGARVRIIFYESDGQIEILSRQEY